MTHEQKPESAEFRTREEIETEMRRLLTHGVRGPNAAKQVVHRIFDEVRAFGASEEQSASRAEQRGKDAEGAEPVGYVLAGLKELFSNPADPLSAAMILASKDAPHIVPLYLRPANVAAPIAEAVAAEREKIANKLDEVAKHLARPWGSHLTEEGIAVKEACAARVEQEAAAIREGGEHG